MFHISPLASLDFVYKTVLLKTSHLFAIALFESSVFEISSATLYLRSRCILHSFLGNRTKSQSKIYLNGRNHNKISMKFRSNTKKINRRETMFLLIEFVLFTVIIWPNQF